MSNCSWEHFWLNEGWTTYLERRIQAKIHGEPHRDFSAIIGWKALEDSIERIGKDHEFTKLVTNLKNEDPDDAFSSIPYEKGYVFLDYLEKLIGREEFDKFIPHVSLANQQILEWNTKMQTVFPHLDAQVPRLVRIQVYTLGLFRFRFQSHCPARQGRLGYLAAQSRIPAKTRL